MIDLDEVRWHIGLTEKEEAIILKHTCKWYLNKPFILGGLEYKGIVLHHCLDNIHIILGANAVGIVIDIPLNIQPKCNVIIVVDLLIAGDFFRYVFPMRLEEGHFFDDFLAIVLASPEEVIVNLYPNMLLFCLYGLVPDNVPVVCTVVLEHLIFIETAEDCIVWILLTEGSDYGCLVIDGIVPDLIFALKAAKAFG